MFTKDEKAQSRRKKTTNVKYFSTRWVSLHRATSWLIEHKVPVTEYLIRKSADCTPSNQWWVVTAVVCYLSQAIRPSVEKLQGASLQLSHQKAQLQMLSTFFADLVCMQGQRFQTEKVVELIENQGCVVTRLFSGLDDQTQTVDIVGHFIVHLASGISAIVAERDSNNNPDTEKIPAVMPHKLVKLTGREFSQQVNRFQERLASFFSDSDIDRMETEWRSLVHLSENDSILRAILEDQNDIRTDFLNGWNGLSDRFSLLYQLSSGLSTVFPGTATVESDFSILGWEKNDYRTSLSDLSLEGILHAKQLSKLSI